MAISVIHHLNLNVNGRMGQVRENCLPPLLTIPTFLIVLFHSVSQILKPKILISALPFPLSCSLHSQLHSALQPPEVQLCAWFGQGFHCESSAQQTLVG